MTANPANLNGLRIATPCPISWEAMTGDNRVRFCDHCQLHVYNISELSRIEAEKLIASTEGRLCARLFRRADGTVITKDCPVGLRALRMRVSKRAAAILAAIVSLSGAAFGQESSGKDKSRSCAQQTKITRTKTVADKNGVLSITVLDTNGAAIAGATIFLTNASSNFSMKGFANEQGTLQFESLDPGSYALQIESPGFLAYKYESIAVDSYLGNQIDVILFAQALTGIVTLIPQVDTAPPGTTIINEQMIRRLPIPK